jgi:Kef-type K+ transport system membrane component KefB
MQNLGLFISVLSSMIAILVISQLFGRLFVLLKQPRVVGEMFSGVFLGLSFYMFIVGLELDHSSSSKKTVKEAGLLSFFNILIPFIFGACFGYFSSALFKGSNGNQLQYMVFVGAALAITAFPMLARILQENGLVKTKIGSLSLLSASFQDAVSWIFLSYVTASAAGAGGVNSLLKTIGYSILFLGVCFFIIKPLLSIYFAKSDRLLGNAGKTSLVIVFILVIVNSLITDVIGLYSVFGGFVTGLLFPKRTEVTDFIRHRLSDVITLLFLPLFFTFSGLNANLLILGQLEFFIPATVITVLAFSSKYLSTLFVMKSSRYSWAESSAMGGLMNARGLMELIIANVGLMYGIINQQLYSILVLIAVTSTLAAMPIYNLSKRFSKKNSFGQNTENADKAEQPFAEAKPAA